ncbi:nucleotidyltransferase family protein [Acidisoma silvae]|uniref:Nucleotidyltransferase family protein n=1 Tax=Acidisoma silvae TaxID=2802396 RepID=A0A963YSS2_9PROT|nr:nucleotidyltransferase family protein [Acidisoma silvae]MCB8876394.1 nucleotidyltransferase family protein [Acidisoma silvae]
MKPSTALASQRHAIRALTGRYRVTNPRVFGSVAKGEDKDGSDLDILVDALPDTTLFDLGALQEELQLLLGVPVDVRTPGDLPDSILARVLTEAQPV